MPTKYYNTPEEYVTVNEQLIGFRNRYSFEVYTLKISDKYGLENVII